MRASRRVLVSAGVALALGAGPGAAGRGTTAAPQGAPPPTPAARWDRAVEAWDSGRYPDALTDCLALLDGPAGSEYLASIALLTGELFPSIEITTDGRRPRLSAGGRYVAWETTANGATHTRLARIEGGVAPLAELAGTGLVFSPAGDQAAWVRPGPNAGAPSAIVIRTLSSGEDRVWLSDGMRKELVGWSGDGQRVFFLATADGSRADVYGVSASGEAIQLTKQPGPKRRALLDRNGGTIVYFSAPPNGRGRGDGGGARGNTAVIEQPERGTARTISGIVGTALAISADGSTLAWIARDENGADVLRRMPTSGGPVTDVRTASGAQRLDAPALSPDGRLVAYQFMAPLGARTDWEIYVTDADGVHRRITEDIQHDVLPRFLTNDLLLGLRGEPRHRRSQLYDLKTGDRRRVFANNTIRTISPEYDWAPSPDGGTLAVEADRDGDTVSPAHSISVLDLTQSVSAADLRARLARQLATETDLRARTARAFEPIADVVRHTVSSITPTRVYRHERTLSSFGSKHISQPGNARAVRYLEQTYRSFGYAPELQWLPEAGRRGGAAGPPSANVVATLRGTVHPDVIYVVSSHFDSVAIGPGADDDSSGTSALLEAARALAGTPLPATVVFASFTGEEAGLLGSREFVRLAAERTWRIAGALNNDMIGWAGESARLDNTIRYSNAGIRDIQHGAALLFSNLILYDAKYYRGTDAGAFYEAWGDIVGGIGSYPVLGNPNYHQPTDVIETVNMAQVAETAKVTAATIVYLASSPSRLTGLRLERTAGGLDLTWTASPERDVASYIVAYGPPDKPFERRLTSRSPRAALPALPAGTAVAVKAINRRGLEGWDWATAAVP